LRRERESRSVSLEEISRCTRISRPYLEALENDNFHFFSKREFVLGFLRGYARHLGLNPEEVLQRYRIQSELDSRKETFQQLPLFSPSVPPAEEITQAEPVLQRLPPSKDRKRSRRSIFVQMAIVLAALSLSFYLHHLIRQAEDPRKSPEVKGAFSRGGDEKSIGEKGRIINSNAKEKRERLPGEAQGSAGKHGSLESQKVRVIGTMKDYDRAESVHREEYNSEEEAARALRQPYGF